MEITIVETNLVLPAQAPFRQDHDLALSHLDTAPDLRTTVRTLRAYVKPPPGGPSPCHCDPVRTISLALSRALVYYYPLAATLCHSSTTTSRLRISCSGGQGVLLTRATANLPLAAVNYLDDPAALFVEQLVPDLNVEGEALAHPLALQVTVFPCGGFSLGMCVHHALCDGLGAAQFLAAMAELVGSGERPPSVLPVWERERLLGPRDPPLMEFPIGEFLSLDKGFSAYSPAPYRVVRECFDIRDEWVERLKAGLKEKSGSGFTTFEALGAFIWRARVAAAGVPGREKVKFVYSANIRKQTAPPLPAGYWGNGCVPVYVQLTARELAEQPLWKTAELIRRSKGNVTDEYVRSYIDFQAMHCGEGITAGRWVSGFTDWRHLGHSAADFGWGAPVSVLPLSWNLMGCMEPCFFLPCRAAMEKKDGFRILVSVPEAATTALRAEMETLRSRM